MEEPPFDRAALAELVDESLYERALVPRAAWGAAPPLDTQPLGSPVAIIVCTNTGTAECHSLEECARTVRQIQEVNMTKQKMPDILYHFLIGGDGNIYEGRGWTTYAPPAFKNKKNLEFMRFKTINIVLIGDFLTNNNDVEPPENMLLTRRDLIGYGLKHRYIDVKSVAMWHEF